jgi:SAM-dependent methyltransferase
MDSKEFYEGYFDKDIYSAYVWDVGAVATRRAVRDLIGKNSDVLLELGSGFGISLQEIQFPLKVGLEYSLNTIVSAKIHSSNSSYFVNGDATNLPFKDCSIDVIISQHVLEHLEDDQKTIDECYRVLRPRGEVIIFVPGRQSGKATKEEWEKNRHYRAYNKSRFEHLLSKYNDSFKMNQIYFVHRAHSIIWNRLKRVFVGLNFIYRKVIARDGKYYTERRIYQRFIMPLFLKLLNKLDVYLNKREDILVGVNYNVLVKIIKYQ